MATTAPVLDRNPDLANAPGPSHLAIVRDGSLSSLRSRPTPTPGPGEVLLAPEKVSLCGTDVQIVRGDRDDPSPIVGHEGAAQVIGIGPGVEGITTGDRVVVNPTHPEDPSFLLGHNVEGLFQQRVLISASAMRGGLVAQIDDTLSSARATLVEPWAVVGYALTAMAQAQPDTLLVAGDGLIGNLAAHVAHGLLGERVQVVALHRSESGRKWTAAFAPHVTGYRWDEAWSDGCGDRVALLVATHRGGTLDAVDDAVRRLGPRLVAVHPIGGVVAGTSCATLPGIDPAGARAANTGGPWPPAVVRFSGRGLDLVMTGNRGVTTDRLTAAARELTSADARVDQLLTHEVGLAEGPKMLDAVCARHQREVDGRRVIRVVVTVNDGVAR